MARRTYRRTAAAKRIKYSVENYGVRIALPEQQVGGLHQFGQTIVPATDVQGTRCVKHLTVSLSSTSSSSAEASDAEFYWALVFIPEGYQPNNLFPSGLDGSLYEPNQFVMGCGFIDPSAGPIRIRSNVSRNLQSGDSIALIVGS